MASAGLLVVGLGWVVVVVGAGLGVGAGAGTVGGVLLVLVVVVRMCAILVVCCSCDAVFEILLYCCAVMCWADNLFETAMPILPWAEGTCASYS